MSVLELMTLFHFGSGGSESEPLVERGSTVKKAVVRIPGGEGLLFDFHLYTRALVARASLTVGEVAVELWMQHAFIAMLPRVHIKAA